MSESWTPLTREDLIIKMSTNGNVVVTWAPPGHGQFYVEREYPNVLEAHAVEMFLDYINET